MDVDNFGPGSFWLFVGSFGWLWMVSVVVGGFGWFAVLEVTSSERYIFYNKYIHICKRRCKFSKAKSSFSSACEMHSQVPVVQKEK